MHAESESEKLEWFASFRRKVMSINGMTQKDGLSSSTTFAKLVSGGATGASGVVDGSPAGGGGLSSSGSTGAAGESEPLECSGWLDKTGVSSKTYQQRWFELRGKHLWYFDKPGVT